MSEPTTNRPDQSLVDQSLVDQSLVDQSLTPRQREIIRDTLARDAAWRAIVRLAASRGETTTDVAAWLTEQAEIQEEATRLDDQAPISLHDQLLDEYIEAMGDLVDDVDEFTFPEWLHSIVDSVFEDGMRDPGSLRFAADALEVLEGLQ